MTSKEAIEILEPFKAFMFDQNGCPISDAAIALDVAISALRELPPADVRENVRGEWLNLADLPMATVNWSPGEVNYRVCSNCYKNRHVNSGFRAWHKRDTSLMVFCPNCGADMRGLTKDE